MATLLDPQARGRALRLLGQFGDASSLAALEKAAKEDPDPELRKAAQQAWEAAKSRIESGGAPAAPAAAPAPAAGATPRRTSAFGSPAWG